MERDGKEGVAYSTGRELYLYSIECRDASGGSGSCLNDRRLVPALFDGSANGGMCLSDRRLAPVLFDGSANGGMCLSDRRLAPALFDGRCLLSSCLFFPPHFLFLPVCLSLSLSLSFSLSRSVSQTRPEQPRELRHASVSPQSVRCSFFQSLSLSVSVSVCLFFFLFPFLFVTPRPQQASRIRDNTASFASPPLARHSIFFSVLLFGSLFLLLSLCPVSLVMTPRVYLAFGLC